MNKQELLSVLKSEKEVLITDSSLGECPVGELPHGAVSSTVYDIESVPRYNLAPDGTRVLFEASLSLGLSDNGGYCQSLVLGLSATEVAVFDVSWPEYCDDEWDGSGVLVLYEWPKDQADVGVQELVESERRSVVATFIRPVVVDQRDQLLGTSNWTQPLVCALADAVPKENRTGFLRSLAEDARYQIGDEVKAQLMVVAPQLASVIIERGSDYDDQGGYYRYISSIGLAQVDGKTEFFSGSEEVEYGCERQLDDFTAEVGDDLDLGVDWDQQTHREAFDWWMAAKLGVEDFQAFWSLLWGLIDSDPDLQSMTFRDLEKELQS